MAGYKIKDAYELIKLLTNVSWLPPLIIRTPDGREVRAINVIDSDKKIIIDTEEIK